MEKVCHEQCKRCSCSGELLETEKAKELKVVNTGVEEWSATIANDEGTMRESVSSGRTKEALW